MPTATTIPAWALSHFAYPNPDCPSQYPFDFAQGDAQGLREAI